MAGLGALTAWHALAPGVADWDSTVAAAGGSVRWLGPAAAALAAWTAQRGRRLEYLRALAARSPAIGPLHDLLLLGSVSVLGYGLAALIVSGRTILPMGRKARPYGRRGSRSAPTSIQKPLAGGFFHVVAPSLGKPPRPVS